MEKVLISWSKYYSVGIDLFDEQHKELVNMINALYNAFLAGEAQEKAIEIVNKMLDYTDFHFKSEEKYFEMHNYPESEEHKAIHKSFVEKTLELKKGLEDGSKTISYEIMNFLREWLIKHIMGEDKKYSTFFKDNNIEIK